MHVLCVLVLFFLSFFWTSLLCEANKSRTTGIIRLRGQQEPRSPAPISGDTPHVSNSGPHTRFSKGTQVHNCSYCREGTSCERLRPKGKSIDWGGLGLTSIDNEYVSHHASRITYQGSACSRTIDELVVVVRRGKWGKGSRRI